MSLWEPGKVSISLYMLETLRDRCKNEYSDSDEFLINEIIPMDEEHPDNKWASEHPGHAQHHCMVEVTYNTKGHRAGYGLTDDGEWHCFYN